MSPTRRRLGDHGRSGEQFDIWQAVYSPTGEGRLSAADLRQANRRRSITQTAGYWREHYDLNAILQRDWNTLGPKLQGKLHIYVGSDDTYFLNDAVYLMEDFLKADRELPAWCALRGRGSLRTARRALLEWRSDEAELVLAAALQPDVSAPDHGAHPENGAAGADLTSWKY